MIDNLVNHKKIDILNAQIPEEYRIDQFGLLDELVQPRLFFYSNAHFELYSIKNQVILGCFHYSSRPRV